MNAIIETKLRDLWQESLNQNVPAVHVVTHLLLAHCLQGTHGDFAKWCCKHSVGFNMDTSIDGGREVLPGEVPSVTLPSDAPEQGKDWVN